MDNNTLSEKFAECLKLAALVVASVKADYPNCDGALMCGDPPAPTANESMDSVLTAYKNQLPGLARAAADSLPIIDQQKLIQAQSLSDPYAKLGLDLYKNYGEKFNAEGNKINATNRIADAQNDLDVLRGPGKDLAAEALKVSQGIDPEYYNVRKSAGDASTRLIDSINVNGLSGGERSEVERSLNADKVATGNDGNNTQIGTVQNAMSYGNALQGKRDALGKAISTATGFLGTARSGIDPYGRPSTNPGASQFQGVKASDPDSMGFANNVLNQTSQMAGQANQINSQRRDWMDRVNGAISSVSD